MGGTLAGQATREVSPALPEPFCSVQNKISLILADDAYRRTAR